VSTKRIIVRYLPTAALCLLLVLLSSGLFRSLLAAHAAFPPVLSTIFLDTTSPTFTLTTAGSSGTISYTVTDLSGNTITTGQSAVSSSHADLILLSREKAIYVVYFDQQNALALYLF